MSDIRAIVPDPDTGTSRRAVSALGDLLEYCRRNEWAGWDPYDALNSRVFQSLPFRHYRWPRLLLTQFVKRFPVNVRPLLGIPKEQNPKGIALFISTLARLNSVGVDTEAEVQRLAERLLELRRNPQEGGWGYNFDWQTRFYLVPRGTPNIICTSFAGQALLDAYEVTNENRYLEAARQAGEFLLKGLPITRSPQGICLSYTPLQPSRIHNANLLGAALLARLHEKQNTPEFSDAALSAASYSVSRQAVDGSWAYGEDPTQAWIDSFHTGFNLVALAGIRRDLQTEQFTSSIKSGYQFYLDKFFTAEGVPAYFHDRIYPIDIHSAAQAAITCRLLAEFDSRSEEISDRVIGWTLDHMRSPSGYFYAQRGRSWKNGTPFIRWGQAWMCLGMAYLVVPEAVRVRDAAAAKNFF